MITAHLSMRASSQPDILVARDLWKSYGPRQALQGLSFTLKAGRILGLLGPNGAGKTTSILTLATMLEPDAGEFLVDGISSQHPEQIRRKIGVLPENLDLPVQMTGLDYLSHHGELYGLTPAESEKKAQALLTGVGLQAAVKLPLGSYSQEMRQRIGIARALVNDPVAIFLDEPTSGLDPRDQQALLELVQQIAREQNAGIVLSSQLLLEVEQACDDVIILNLGRVVAMGPVTEVIGRVQRNVVLRNALRVQVPAAATLEAQQVLEGMSNILNVRPIGEEEGWLEMELIGTSNGHSLTAYQSNNRILSALIRAKIPILSFSAEADNLQETYLLRGSPQLKDRSYR